MTLQRQQRYPHILLRELQESLDTARKAYDRGDNDLPDTQAFLAEMFHRYHGPVEYDNNEYKRLVSELRLLGLKAHARRSGERKERNAAYWRLVYSYTTPRDIKWRAHLVHLLGRFGNWLDDRSKH
jgi:hypothetical protein